jgi:hypothetical protein
MNALLLFIALLQLGSNPEIDVSAICFMHTSRISQMLANGNTSDQILADFERWLEGHEPITPEYPQMVRDMIAASSKGGNWQDEAFKQCISTMSSKEL